MKIDDKVLQHLSSILFSIQNDCMLALQKHEEEKRGGFFSITRHVFCTVDYLGALISNGICCTENAINYIKTYLGKTKIEYIKYSNIIYDMFRHGTVHEHDPKKYSSSNLNFKLSWGINNTSRPNSRKYHLSCFCNKLNINHYIFFINLFEMTEDLIKSLGNLIIDVKSNPELHQKVERNYNKLNMDFDLDLDKNSKYLDESIELKDNSIGVMGEQGREIKEFKDKKELEFFIQNEWAKAKPSRMGQQPTNK